MLTSLRTDKPVAPGFEHVHRYWDKKTGNTGRKLSPVNILYPRKVSQLLLCSDPAFLFVQEIRCSELVG